MILQNAYYCNVYIVTPITTTFFHHTLAVLTHLTAPPIGLKKTIAFIFLVQKVVELYFAIFTKSIQYIINVYMIKYKYSSHKIP